MSGPVRFRVWYNAFAKGTRETFARLLRRASLLTVILVNVFFRDNNLILRLLRMTRGDVGYVPLRRRAENCGDQRVVIAGECQKHAHEYHQSHRARVHIDPFLVRLYDETGENSFICRFDYLPLK